jgi:hypothetical protein
MNLGSQLSTLAECYCCANLDFSRWDKGSRKGITELVDLVDTCTLLMEGIKDILWRVLKDILWVELTRKKSDM